MRGGASTYGYVGGNPTIRRDPLGLKITVLGDRSAYNAAIGRLVWDPGMAKILNNLDSSDTEYKIIYISDHNDRYDPVTHTIYWDPNSALLCTNGFRQTPALGLGHEMAHANAAAWQRLIGWIPWPGYQKLEEWRVISGPEAAAAMRLGDGIRTDHGGDPYHVSSPTSK